MVHQRKHRRNVERIWLLVVDSWKTYIYHYRLYLTFTNDFWINSRFREEYSQVRYSLSSCVPVELTRSHLQAPSSSVTSNLCPMPAPLSWPTFTSTSRTQKNKTHALYYRPSLSNSRIIPINSVTSFTNYTRSMKTDRSNQTMLRSFDASKVCLRSRTQDLSIS